MQGRPPVALGSGGYLAGFAAAAALLAGTPYDLVAAVAVVGFCLGVVAGGLLVTHSQFLGHSAVPRAAGLPVLALGLWVTWTGVQRGAGGRYQFAIGSVFAAVVGWAVVAGGDRTGGPESETLATLPPTIRRGTGSERRRRLKLVVDVAALVAVGYLCYRAATRSNPSGWLIAGLCLAVFAPGGRSRARLTDDGVVVTEYVCWLVPFDRSAVPWREIYGYDATGDRLRIATEFGRDFVYDTDRIDAVDAVVGVLDDRVPRL